MNEHEETHRRLRASLLKELSEIVRERRKSLSVDEQAICAVAFSEAMLAVAATLLMASAGRPLNAERLEFLSVKFKQDCAR